jgi:hypothetical protein
MGILRSQISLHQDLDFPASGKALESHKQQPKRKQEHLAENHMSNIGGRLILSAMRLLRQ